MNSIYVSSTYADLRDYRLAVIGTLRRMHHQVVCMEDYGAADQRPLHKCLRDVEVCDLYVGLFAWRYGFVPTHDNPHGRSITELEYRHARELGKACLIFLLDNQQPWPPDYMDSGPDRERLLALRAELSNRYLVGFFRSESDLATHVATAVHNGIADLERQEKDDPPQDDTQPPPILFQVKEFAKTAHDPRDLLTKMAPVRRAERPGILAWAVRGCLKWQREARRASPLLPKNRTFSKKTCVPLVVLLQRNR